MHAHPPSVKRRRRGLTLVEMLVTVALVLLIMVVITSVFRSAATVASRQKISMEQETTLRRLDSLIRQDLRGATFLLEPAKQPYSSALPYSNDSFTFFQPINPRDNLGYFEYGENSIADKQGEDGDDYLAFTTKSPEGQPFRGFVVVRGVNLAGTPIFSRVPITSNYAEVIYYHRNGNLYRRVLLIVPERKGQLVTGPIHGGGFYAQVVNGSLVIDPLQTNAGGQYVPVSWHAMNTISARPSPQGTSYAPVPNTLGDLTNRENRFARPRFSDDYINAAGAAVPDGIPDDSNGDGIPDRYPTLYPNVPVSNGLTAGVNDGVGTRAGVSTDQLPFPYMFPGAYTNAGTRAADDIHYTDPTAANTANNLPQRYDPAFINHNPIPTTIANDNLPLPAANQTWWGFPTAQEMLSPYWTDPVKRINDPAGAPYYSVNTFQLNTGAGDAANAQAPGLSWATPTLLPRMNTPFRPVAQPSNDGSGTVTFAALAAAATQPDLLWSLVGESTDLALTGVRCFDVKAYDPVARGYVDLGWAFNPANANTTLPIQYFTLGHEGRMPPVLSVAGGATGDFRLDSQWPLAGFFVGDANATTLRMRRVWDSWSTDYAFPPDTPYGNPFASPANGNRPAFPGYSAPYPVPLTGIQVHIRITDARSERVKVLTIRQDFTDKL
jgi:prepilin-type N-terminal cleavage/methylation domain-containing protein